MVILLTILLVVFLLAPPWSILVLALGVVLELFEIKLLLSWSRRLERKTKDTTGVEAMIGGTAEVVEPCLPTGTVMYQGELWEASSSPDARRGDRVRIVAVEGLRLRVAPTR